MKIEEQYKTLLILKDEINFRLKNLDIYRIKGLIVWLLQSQGYQKMKQKDSQLQALDFFMQIWPMEIKNKDAFEMQGGIFYGVSSLETLERKYQIAKFAILRLENDMPHEYCLRAVEEVCQYQFSAYALFELIEGESEKKEINILKLSRCFKEKEEWIRAIGLLQKGVEKYPANKELLLELADCWMTVGEWKQAYVCLCQIKKPGKKIQEMISELEKVVKYENV